MGDFLFDEMRKLYPGMSDDDVINRIQLADATPTPPKDNSYITPPAPEVQAVQPAPDMTQPAPNPYREMALENVRQKYLGDQYSDQARQDILNQNKSESSGPNVAAGFAALGAGLAGRDPTSAASAILRDQAAKRNERLTDFDEARKAQLGDLKTGQDLTKFEQDQAKLARERDPNSAESKMAQDLAIQMGMKPEQAAGLTAEKFKDFSPIMEKKYQVAEQAQARRDVADENARSRKDALEMKKLERSDSVQDKAMTSTTQLLESARGNPAAAQAERDIYAANKAKSLANMYGDPNKLSSRQVNLLVSEVGKIAQGGVPQMAELEGLAPDTLRGKLSRVWEKLSNSPTPANAADFVKQYTDYANLVAKDAQKVISDKYGRVIESRKDQLGPKNYKALQDQYLNRFKNESASTDASTPSMNQTDQMKTVNGKQYKKVPGGWQEVE